MADVSDLKILNPRQSSELQNISEYIGSQLNGSLTWDYLDEIGKAWDGPMVLKGLLHDEDIDRAVGAGVDGLVISNHGGRQLDAVPPSILRLPDIRARLGDDFTLMVDSGVRSGLDMRGLLPAGLILCCWGAPLCLVLPLLVSKAALMWSLF